MKRSLIIFFSIITLSVHAGEGIQFSALSWKDAKAKAIKEKKVIFIDFYTQWCGPCLMMQKKVFVLDEVASFFNTNFINLKVDAEHGEGIELAKKYAVKVFPTYSFIDAGTGELMHESVGFKEKDVFIQIAKDVFDPSKKSTYLVNQYKAGNKNPDFLIDYANYEASLFNREEVTKIAEQLITVPGYSLENEKVWKLFVNHLSGKENLLFKDLLANSKKYIALHGKEAVDEKLYDAYRFANEPEGLKQVPDFKGKEYLIKRSEANSLINAGKYEEAAVILDKMLADPGDFKAEIVNHVYFISRSSLAPQYRFINKVNKVLPDWWKKKALSYMQYAAYNMPNREDAQVHYFYASILEEFLKSIPEAAKMLPDNFASPLYGNKEYDLRPVELKKKPIKTQ